MVVVNRNQILRDIRAIRSFYEKLIEIANDSLKFKDDIATISLEEWLSGMPEEEFECYKNFNVKVDNDFVEKSIDILEDLQCEVNDYLKYLRMVRLEQL